MTGLSSSKGVGVLLAVGVEVLVAVGVMVGVAVAATMLMVAPVTGKPLKEAVWPLFPAAAVKLKL